ncbi:flavin reductase family protein [Streptomyces sp. A5-4]|uniref:flavin reductase family protein n=1 Tax=Streptomyces sp. A5-4 TaxID=3384771 RepID=UPI003DA9E39F
MADLEGFIDRLDYPVYVVTTAAAGEQAGCLVGFASQCSIEPVRFMIWLSRANRTLRVARAATHLAVHLLGREQRALAELFGGESGERIDKFARVPWASGSGDVPVLADAPAWFVGRIETLVDGGDHVGFLLDPVADGEPGEREGALLRLSDAIDIEPGHPVG